MVAIGEVVRSDTADSCTLGDRERSVLSAPFHEVVAVCPASGQWAFVNSSHCQERSMSVARTIEVFSAGSSICEEIVELVRQTTDSSCEVRVLDIRDCKVIKQARELAVKVVPAIVVDGQLQEYCLSRQRCLEVLKANGLCKDDGSPIGVDPS